MGKAAALAVAIPCSQSQTTWSGRWWGRGLPDQRRTAAAPIRADDRFAVFVGPVKEGKEEEGENQQ